MTIQHIMVKSCVVIKFKINIIIINIAFINRICSINERFGSNFINPYHFNILIQHLLSKAYKLYRFHSISRIGFLKLISLTSNLGPSLRSMTFYVGFDGYRHILIGILAIIAVDYFSSQVNVLNPFYFKRNRSRFIASKVLQRNRVFHRLSIRFFPFRTIAFLYFNPVRCRRLNRFICNNGNDL